MIKSMTGYGYSRVENDDFILTVEVKALNSKFLDLSIKLPKLFSFKEPELRNDIMEIMVRGKVSIEIEFQPKQDSISKVRYNDELFKIYYADLKKLADSVVADYDGLFKLAIQSPDVSSTVVSEKEIDMIWPTIYDEVIKAVKICDQYRILEGEKLAPKFKEYVNKIGDHLGLVNKNENKRIERIRKRITNNLNEFLEEGQEFDPNRFEQELIFYLEKLDIHEEMVRLKTHLDYFIEVLDSKVSTGKKLNFISQEIGREINTIGSKANDSEIQKTVVEMKDQLEKIKEQLFNIL